jgi:hypothetical protein
VQLRDGDYLRFAAHHGPIPIELDKWQINRKWLSGRAVTDKMTLQVEDLLAAEDEFPDGAELARRMGHRTLLSVPMVALKTTRIWRLIHSSGRSPGS